MIYTLERESDGAGDSGPMSMIFWKDPVSGEIEKEIDARPKIGAVIRVGSYTSRSYYYQDYWQTTYIEEILEETENMVKFRTTNSIYVWTCHD